MGRMSGNRGWIPQQHGAWAMLVAPLLVGLVVRSRDGLPAWALPLAATWLLGYFAFNACGLWLKAAPRRRASHLPALLTWAGLAALAGVATLLLGGWPLLWWVPFFCPLLGTALWLTSRRHERALLSGLCTVLAACLLVPILEFTTPQAAWVAWPHPRLADALALFGYFFGTVFVVKTLIRERGKPGWVAASVGWHAVWVLLALAGHRHGLAGTAWIVFFVLSTAKAWLLPWIGPRRDRTIRPAQVGLVEIAFSLAALAICLW
ncbi:YwiC-like family protein [Luteococcus sediminum]